MNKNLWRTLKRDDRGAALAVVIGTMVVFSLVAVTLVSSSMFSSATSQRARAALQVQNAAEQAIDRVHALLNSSQRGLEASFPCGVPDTVTTPTITVTTTVKVLYSNDGGSTYGCPLVSGTDLTHAKLTAHAEGTLLTGQGTAAIRRVVAQELEQPSGTSSNPLLGFGVFSGGDLETTNNFSVIDGGAHTNGHFRCNSSAEIRGPVTAVRNGSITNDCYMEGLWVGGTVSCTSNSLIDGDLVAAGTGTSQMTNTCTVTGHSVVGGELSLGGLTPKAGYTYNFAKDLVSSTGGVTFANGPGRVGGNLQVATSTDAKPSNVAGSITTGSPSTVPPGPPTVEMPAIHWSDLTSAGTPPVVPFGEWVKENAEANNAPSWSTARSGTECSIDAASYSMNGGLLGPEVATTLDGRSCDVSLQAFVGEKALVLREDLTIVARSFRSTNGLHVTSVKPGPEHAKLRFIVPLPEGASTCSGAGNGSIQLVAGGVELAPNVEVLFYTNGNIQLANGVDFTGSVYGCTTTFSNDSTIRYADMTPPGLEPPPDTHYSFIAGSRYDRNEND